MCCISTLTGEWALEQLCNFSPNFFGVCPQFVVVELLATHQKVDEKWANFEKLLSCPLSGQPDEFHRSCQNWGEDTWPALRVRSSRLFLWAFSPWYHSRRRSRMQTPRAEVGRQSRCHRSALSDCCVGTRILGCQSFACVSGDNNIGRGWSVN